MPCAQVLSASDSLGLAFPLSFPDFVESITKSGLVCCPQHACSCVLLPTCLLLWAFTLCMRRLTRAGRLCRSSLCSSLLPHSA